MQINQARGVFFCKKRSYFGKDKALCCDAKDEWVLTEGKLAGSLWALPCKVLFHQVDVVESAVVELGVRDQRIASVQPIVARICKSRRSAVC